MSKQIALQAVAACKGDVSHAGLAAAGLNTRYATIVAGTLERLGCTRRVRAARVLSVPVPEAVAALQALPGDVLTDDSARRRGDDRYVVVADPHGWFDHGEYLSRVYVETLLEEQWPEVDGLEVQAKGSGSVYRTYGGEMHELVTHA